MMNDTPENYVLVLNRADYADFHDALYVWVLRWVEDRASYEIVDTGSITLVLPGDGLREKFHTLHLQRPER